MCSLTLPACTFVLDCTLSSLRSQGDLPLKEGPSPASQRAASNALQAGRIQVTRIFQLLVFEANGWGATAKSERWSWGEVVMLPAAHKPCCGRRLRCFGRKYGAKRGRIPTAPVPKAGEGRTWAGQAKHHEHHSAQAEIDHLPRFPRLARDSADPIREQQANWAQHATN